MRTSFSCWIISHQESNPNKSDQRYSQVIPQGPQQVCVHSHESKKTIFGQSQGWPLEPVSFFKVLVAPCQFCLWCILPLHPFPQFQWQYSGLWSQAGWTSQLCLIPILMYQPPCSLYRPCTLTPSCSFSLSFSPEKMEKFLAKLWFCSGSRHHQRTCPKKPALLL